MSSVPPPPPPNASSTKVPASSFKPGSAKAKTGNVLNQEELSLVGFVRADFNKTLSVILVKNENLDDAITIDLSSYVDSSGVVMADEFLRDNSACDLPKDVVFRAINAATIKYVSEMSNYWRREFIRKNLASKTPKSTSPPSTPASTTSTSAPADSGPKYRLMTVSRDVPSFDKDIETLTYKTYHKLVVKGLSQDARKMYNSIVGMSPDDKANLIKALIIGKVNTQSMAYTPEFIKECDAVPDNQLRDPDEFPGALVDSPHSRLRAELRKKFFIEDGFEIGSKIIICAFGVLLYYPKQNVAYQYNEHKYAYYAFTNFCVGRYEKILRLMMNRMYHMDLNYNPDGAFVKISPKYVTYLPDDPNAENQMTLRSADAQSLYAAVTCVKHGSYPSPDFKTYAKSTELPQLALTLQAPSPVGLFAAMHKLKAGDEFLVRVSTLFSRTLPKVSFTQVEFLYRVILGMVHGEQPFQAYTTPEYHEVFYNDVIAPAVLPFVSKDKGITRSLSMILNPYGAFIPLIGEALIYLGGESVFTNTWAVCCATDVAVSLGLKIVQHDNRITLGRDGSVRVFDNKAFSELSNVYSDYTRHVSRDVKTMTVVVDKITQQPHAKCLMDLAAPFQLYRLSTDATLENAYSKNKTKKIEYFAHDFPDMAYVSANLIIKHTDGSPKCAFDAFVVIVNYKRLDGKTNAAFRGVMNLYNCVVVPGPLFMNNSVFLVGVAKSLSTATKFLSHINSFQSVTTLLAKRAHLLNELYNGIIDDTTRWSELQHTCIGDSQYLKYVKGMLRDDDTLELFNYKEKMVEYTRFDVPEIQIDSSNLSKDWEYKDGDDAVFDFFH